MTRLQVFDPPMCCSTGVCGPEVDPALVQSAADFRWLAGEGILVERFNLAQQPQAFAGDATVRNALTNEGNACLPLILVDGQIVVRGRYPTRQELACFAGLEPNYTPSIFTDAVRELVAIGAAIAANSETRFKYHLTHARKLRISGEDVLLAVEIAQTVKESPAHSIREMADRLLKHGHTPPVSLPIMTASCCSPASSPAEDSSKGSR